MIGKLSNLNVLGAVKAKSPKQDSQNILGSPEMRRAH